MLYRLKNLGNTHPVLYRLLILAGGGTCIYHLGYMIGKFVYHFINR